MSERLGNLRPSWIAFGWFISAAVTALVFFAFVAFGVMDGDPAAGGVWLAVALLLGFTVGGYIVGVRTGTAPLLHGIAIGLFSLVVWVALNLVFGEPTGETTWTALPTVTVAALLVLQTSAAVVGARFGVRWGRS